MSNIRVNRKLYKYIVTYKETSLEFKYFSKIVEWAESNNLFITKSGIKHLTPFSTTLKYTQKDLEILTIKLQNV